MKTLTKYGIGTLTIALLLGLGLYANPDDNYFCRDLEIGRYCDRLSGSGNTCYPTAGTRTGSKFCSSGWEFIAEEFEFDINRLSKTGIWKERCNNQGCVRIP